MAAIVSTYQYTYGAGNAPNRRIEFHQDGKKVWGIVQGQAYGVWKNIGKIDECNMTLEEASTTQKVQIMMDARKKFESPNYPPDKRFDELDYDRRIQVIKNLEPNGPYRITISNNIGSNPYFESVEELTFFDPS